MQKLKAVLTASLLTLAAPAFAQEIKLSPQEEDLYFAGDFCQQARADAAMSVDDKIATCQRTFESLDKVRQKYPEASQRELNAYCELRAFAHMVLAGMYANVDKSRTQRACDMAEASWADLSKIVDAASAAEYQEAYKQMRTSGAMTVRVCRKEKGTPPGAPPVPPA